MIIMFVIVTATIILLCARMSHKGGERKQHAMEERNRILRDRNAVLEYRCTKGGIPYFDVMFAEKLYYVARVGDYLYNKYHSNIGAFEWDFADRPSIWGDNIIIISAGDGRIFRIHISRQDILGSQ